MNIPIKIQTSSSFFPAFIQDGSYYVDKTLLVQEIVEQNKEVSLYARPRRFGKSLNQSMLQAFFGVRTADEYKHLFDGLAISQNRELCEKHQGKYPVIKLSFARACTNSFEKNSLGIAKSIQDAIYEYRDIILAEDAASNPRVEVFRDYIRAKLPVLEDTDILRMFTEFLHQHYKQKCIILLDEYDVPIQNAFLNNHYEEMMSLMRPLMLSTFKDNPHLRWGVITGCLKVAKESIFTGLNTPYVNTILSQSPLQEHFGFTQAEVDKLLEAAGLMNYRDLVKQWYDGYLFGDREVYNPFSVVLFVNDTMNAGSPQTKCFWANSSGNDIIRRLLQQQETDVTRNLLQGLIDGQSATLPIVENTVFREMDNDPAALWTTMLFTGYLKPAAPVPVNAIAAPMVLPNYEVRDLIEKIIIQWLREDFRPNVTPLMEALLKGDAVTAQQKLNRHLRETISCRDFLENYYHGFLAGLLASGRGQYRTSSNFELGDGYPDIQIGALDDSAIAVIEVKHTSDAAKLPAVLDEAEKQFRSRHYDSARDDYQTFHGYAIAFCHKQCVVRLLE